MPLLQAKLGIQSVPQSLVSVSAFQTEIPLQTKVQICSTFLHRWLSLEEQTAPLPLTPHTAGSSSAQKLTKN